MHFKFVCKVLELHITGHHAPCQERSIEMLEIWRDEWLSLNRGRVFLLPWSLECLWNCFTCTALTLQWMSLQHEKPEGLASLAIRFGIGWWFCACQTCWFNRLLVTFGHWSCGMDPATIQHVKPAALAALRKDVWWTLSISFSRKVDMFVKQLLHCTGLSAQRVQLKLGWTPQKSHASWCCHMISIYFSCRLYQLWGFSNMFPSCLPWVFSAALTRQDGGFGIRGRELSMGQSTFCMLEL